jgi:crotonobetainyl-CoA:carnitine CoA-transferase CaiB-like acyl-CoA transferase
MGAVRMLGSPEWTRDPMFASENLRLKNSDAMDALLIDWFMRHDKEDIFHRAQAEGVPCFPLYNVREVSENRHYSARDFFVECDHPIAGRFTMPGPPYRLSRTPVKLRRPAPILGEHNSMIFCDRLGMKPDELHALRLDKVI